MIEIRKGNLSSTYFGRSLQILEIRGLFVGSVRVEVVTDALRLAFSHQQECCECVEVSDCDSVDNRLFANRVVYLYEIVERTVEGDIEYGIERCTFYEIKTSEGDFCFTFRGRSNGYYSVGVDIVEILNEDAGSDSSAVSGLDEAAEEDYLQKTLSNVPMPIYIF